MSIELDIVVGPSLRLDVNVVGPSLRLDVNVVATSGSGGSGGAPWTDFVYSPSGSQADNVYTDWDALYAAVLVAGSGPKTITFTEDCTIAPATPTTYDLSECVLLGNGIGFTTNDIQTIWVKLGTNFYLDNSMPWLKIDRGLTLESISTDYLITPTGSFHILIDGSACIGTTTQSIVHFTVDFAVCAVVTQANAGNSYVVGQGGENLNGPSGNPAPLGGYELIDASGNSIVSLTSQGYSVWSELGTARGECLILVRNLSSAISWASDWTGTTIVPFHDMTNPNLTINFTTFPFTNAAADAINYSGGGGATWTTTAVGTEWATAYPDSVMDAIDRLAAAVAGLLGTPIP